jgi:hypothetical protein
VTEPGPYVVENREDFDAVGVFREGLDQVVLAVRITPVYGQIDLGLLAAILEAANERGFALARENAFRDEWLLCVFEAYEDD